MKDTEYTFAVARIRSNENKLLSSSELSSIISAPTYKDAVQRLSDKGYEINGNDYSAALMKKARERWELIYEILPDKSQFNSIIIKNDFQNLKVAAKAFFTGKETDGLFLYPSVYDPEEIKTNVFARKNSLLPECLQHADRSAYRILSKTRFAQLADSVIDRASMEWSLKTAKQSDVPFLEELAETQTALTDIKVLYRCILTNKAPSFTERAVASCAAFSKSGITAAASKGMEDFFTFLEHTDYKGAADALKSSPAEFERWCDNRLLELLKCTKTEVFGISPIVAFYYASETELKNVRIILSAKSTGQSEEVIRQRVRDSFV